MGGGDRGIVVFDNTGTLSTVVLETVATVEASVETPVPEIPASSPTALVSLEITEYSGFDVEESIGEVIAALDVPIHVALANVDVSTGRVRAALEADQETSARTVVEQVAALRDAVAEGYPAWVEPPVGVQVVVDLDAKRVTRVFGYTTVPLEVGRSVVAEVESLGFVPHIVSGDASHILEAVGHAVDIPVERIHAYQSAQDKATTVDQIREATGGPVVMIGDYVNDAEAFAEADYAIYIQDTDQPHPELVAVADEVVDSLDAVVACLTECEVV